MSENLSERDLQERAALANDFRAGKLDHTLPPARCPGGCGTARLIHRDGRTPDRCQGCWDACDRRAAAKAGIPEVVEAIEPETGLVTLTAVQLAAWVGATR